MSKITIDELYGKTIEQLYKEASRRGIPGYRLPKSQLIQAILEHDAYYEGVNDARQNTVRNGKPGVVVSTTTVVTPAPEPQRELYCFVDYDDYGSEPIIMLLTPEQVKFIKMLRDNGIVYDTLEIHKIAQKDIISP